MPPRTPSHRNATETAGRQLRKICGLRSLPVPANSNAPDDPMPTDDAEALLAWAKRNIQDE